MLIDKHPESPSPISGAGHEGEKDGKGRNGKSGGDGKLSYVVHFKEICNYTSMIF